MVLSWYMLAPSTTPGSWGSRNGARRLLAASRSWGSRNGIKRFFTAGAEEEKNLSPKVLDFVTLGFKKMEELDLKAQLWHINFNHVR